jgi:hypothetical protein
MISYQNNNQKLVLTDYIYQKSIKKQKNNIREYASMGLAWVDFPLKYHQTNFDVLY